MRRITAIIAVALAIAGIASCGGSGKKGSGADSTQVDSAFLKYDKVRDLALIYQGGAHRIDWTEDQFAPYVTHKFADGTEDWIFDGYLFLEFKDGRGAQLSPGYDSINATRQVWEWYLDRIFEPAMAEEERTSRINGWNKAVKCAYGWAKD